MQRTNFIYIPKLGLYVHFFSFYSPPQQPPQTDSETLLCFKSSFYYWDFHIWGCWREQEKLSMGCGVYCYSHLKEENTMTIWSTLPSIPWGKNLQILSLPLASALQFYSYLYWGINQVSLEEFPCFFFFYLCLFSYVLPFQILLGILFRKQPQSSIDSFTHSFTNTALQVRSSDIQSLEEEKWVLSLPNCRIRGPCKATQPTTWKQNFFIGKRLGSFAGLFVDGSHVICGSLYYFASQYYRRGSTARNSK